jgi:DNA-binding CsgD family transcriptional regulator
MPSPQPKFGRSRPDGETKQRKGMLTEADCRVIASCMEVSEREIQVLMLISERKTYAQIAQQLCIVTRTVQAHASSLHGKFGVRNRLDLVLEAIRILEELRQDY